MQKNKKNIPTFVISKGGEIFSTQFGFKKDKTLISYISKKEKNCFFLLSTFHYDDTIYDTSGEKKKSDIISFL